MNWISIGDCKYDETSMQLNEICPMKLFSDYIKFNIDIKYLKNKYKTIIT